MDWTVKLADVAIIVATLVGPILAVWASDRRQQLKGERDRKEWVFRNLMTTRTAKLRAEHVAAINMIQFAFPRATSAKVEDARSLYRRHLRNHESVSPDTPVRNAWAARASDLFADLLYSMAEELKIPFTRSDITEESYHPDALVEAEFEQMQLRKLLLEVLRDGRPISMKVQVPSSP